MIRSKKNRLILVGIHLLFGFLVTFPWGAELYSYLSILSLLVILFYYKNDNEEALLVSSYIVGAEVFIRMNEGLPFYEIGKYTVILFLLIGMIFTSEKQKVVFPYLIYLLLLFIGIVLVEVPEGDSLRNSILFNLSGPFVLGVSAFYFYERTIDLDRLLDALFVMILPLFSMITYLYFRTPDIEEIVFGRLSNFETSGGFGPNQVSTIIGVGFFILAIFIILKKRVTIFVALDLLFLIYFIYRGLITFSRGGLISASLGCIIFFIFYFLSKKKEPLILLRYILIGLTFTLSIWIYTSNITRGALDNRYGITGGYADDIEKDLAHGRIAIFSYQLSSFLENPLGIGVGNGKYKRINSGERIVAASHNEIGRALEEHGILGLIILIILIIYPILNFRKSNNFQRAFVVSFFVFWFLTISHSAMRIAFPGFIYGLSLIKIKEKDA